MNNPYDVLGVSPDVSNEEIKKAYKNLARKWHPDLHKGDPKAEEKFKEINAAYEMVKDGKWQQQQMPGGMHINVDELFRQHFGGNGWSGIHNPFNNPTRTIRKKKGQIKVTFEEAFSGCEKKLQIQETEPCESCGGVGHSLKDQFCKTCNGNGQVRTQRGPVQIVMTCNTCKGLGREIGDPCGACGASGKKIKIREENIKIPPGTRYGSVFQPSPDLEVVILYHDHKYFSLANNLSDIVSEVSISMFDAILGGSVAVNTLSGQKKLKISPGTNPGTILRIKGAGFKNQMGQIGDHMVGINVEFPKKLTAEQKHLLIQLKNSLKQGDKNGEK